jgi:hypothetical protein
VNHISEENLERYCLGTGDNAAAIEEHLLWCHECQDEYVEIEAFIDAMRVALRQPIGSRGAILSSSR